MRRVNVIVWGLCIATAMAACGEPEESELASERAAVGGDPGENPGDPGDPDEPECPPDIECNKGQQGRETLGLSSPNAVYSFNPIGAYWAAPAGKPLILGASVDWRGLKIMALQPDGSVKRLPTSELLGLMLPTGAVSASRIVGYAPDDAMGRGRYVVQYQAGTSWKALCPLADVSYALPGYFFTALRSHFNASSETASFACRNSAAAKALRWDFGPIQGSSRQDAYTAAIRMARAEYCSDDASYTVDGTTIAFAAIGGLGANAIADDLAGPSVLTPGEFHIEAAWRGDGTAPGNSEGDPATHQVACLGKLRWQALKPSGPCPEILQDPRYYDDAHPENVVCEVATGSEGVPTAASLQQLRSAYGVTVVSLSQQNDVGLWSWWKSGQLDRMTTTAGYWSKVASQVSIPEDGYVIDGPNGVLEKAWVAGILTQPAPNTKALRLFYNVDTHDYRTTTNPYFGLPPVCSPPGSCGSGPWQLKGILGYVYNDANVKKGFKPVELHNFTRKITILNHDQILDVVLLRKGASRQFYTMDPTIEGYGFE